MGREVAPGPAFCVFFLYYPTWTWGKRVRSPQLRVHVREESAWCDVVSQRIALANHSHSWACKPRATLQGTCGRASEGREVLKSESCICKGLLCSQLADDAPLGFAWFGLPAC